VGLSLRWPVSGGNAYLNKPTVEPRGQARGLMVMGHAAFLAPDSDPSKTTWTLAVNNNIAAREGFFNITNGSFYDNNPGSMWYFGRNTVAGGLGNPLYIFEPAGLFGDIFTADPGSFDSTHTCGGWGPWMTSLNIITFGRLAELGFSANAALQAHATWLIHGLIDKRYSPYLIATYQYPEFSKTSPCNSATPYLQTWTAMKSAWTAGTETSKQAYYWQPGGGGYGLYYADGYPYITRAAASFTPGTIDSSLTGTDAWTWIYAQSAVTTGVDNDPKWALVPRAGQGGTKRQTGKISFTGKVSTH
jgi:hypothetical protein